jgi:hypothetical protein
MRCSFCYVLRLFRDIVCLPLRYVLDLFSMLLTMYHAAHHVGPVAQRARPEKDQEKARRVVIQ